MEAPARELAAGGVEGERPVAGDGRPALDERAAVAAAAEPEGLDPDHGEDGEAVVELGHVDVGRREVGPLPQGGPGVPGGHRGHVVELVPAGPAPQGGAHRVDLAGRVVEGALVLAPGDHDGGRAVAGRVAVVEAQRGRDHAGGEVVVEGERVAVDGPVVQGRVAPAVEGDLGQLLAGEAELVDPALGDQGDPVRRRHRAERQVPLEEPREARHAAAASAAATDALPTARALGRRLGDGAIDEDVAGEAGPHGQRGGDDRAHLGRALAATVVPVDPEAQGVLDLGGARPGEAGRAGAHAGVGGDPVDVVAGEPGIGDGGERGLDGEVELGPPEAPAHL